MSIIYEVTLLIEHEVVREYDIWLKHHVDKMLELPGFEHAQVFVIEDDASESARAGRVVHYHLDDRPALDEYFRRFAQQMRDDGIRRFGQRFSASRRILRALEIEEAGT